MSKILSTDFCPESVLLTGSSGFIGSFVNKLLDYRCCIATRTFGPKSSNSRQLLMSNLIGSKTQSLLDGTQVVIHLAGLAHSDTFQKEDYREVNFLGTLRLAQQASLSGVKRFVFVSSIGVNGTSTLDKPFSINSKVNPHNAYAKSKYDAEEGLKKIAQVSGMELVIVRPTLVYGPNAPGNFGSLTKLVKKLPFLPFGLTNNKRDFISVLNLADFLITCASHPNAAGHTFLASDCETVSIKEFTNAIAKGLNKSLIQLPIPTSLMQFTGKLLSKSAMVEQLIGNLEVDSSNLKEVLDWVPPYTMEESMAFLKQEK